jgi:hypothetical protein
MALQHEGFRICAVPELAVQLFCYFASSIKISNAVVDRQTDLLYIATYLGYRNKDREKIGSFQGTGQWGGGR